jgi:fermentation-respiration switch protein FrsA (DUF1100 family)
LILVLCAGITGCTQLFFFPMKQQVRTPADIGLAYEDVYFPGGNDRRLHGWFLPATGHARATVLFLHGNAENISTHIGSVYWLPERGFNVLIFDYQGYGQSEGEPSIAGALDDVEAALGFLVQHGQHDGKPVVVFGQSLGGALAIHAVVHSAYRTHIRGLIVDSAFADYRLIAREKLAGFWLTWPLQWPLSLIINDDYSPLSVVGEVAPIPLLIMHGDRDQVIPVHHAWVLYEQAHEPKSIWIFPDGSHGRALNNAAARNRLVSYMNELLLTGVRSCPATDSQTVAQLSMDVEQNLPKTIRITRIAPGDDERLSRRCSAPAVQ